MNRKQSAGILLFRKRNHKLEVFLVHPGGPFWKNKQDGAWSIPKGEMDDREEAFHAAIREFKEETGQTVSGNFIQLHPVIQKSGKKVHAWALEKNLEAQQIISDNFELEWPPHSGKLQHFPEVDKASWFGLKEAKKRINPSQVAFLEELEKKVMI